MKKHLKRIGAVFVTSMLVVGLGCQQGEIDPNQPGYLVPKTVDEDPALPSIKISDTQLHAEAFGDAKNPMLVILHGGPGADYRSLLSCKQFISNGFYVVFYDQRGSGLSKRHPQHAYKSTTMRDDLDAVITYYRRSPAQKVFLLGHSWGAMLACQYLNDKPNAPISGLVLAEPGGLIYQDILDYIKRSRAFSATGEAFTDALYVDQFLTARQDEHQLADYKLLVIGGNVDTKNSPTGDDRIDPIWRPGYAVSAAFARLGEKEKPNWTPNLKRYKTKVLFLYSERSKAYGIDWAKRVSSAFPNVQLSMVKGGGHNTMVSSPEAWTSFYQLSSTYLDALK